MITDTGYEDLAKAIVSDYITHSVSLHDGVVKVAEDMGLSPDSTNLLLQKTNLTAHLTLHEKLAGSDHRCVEFDVVVPKDVMSQVYGEVDAKDTCHEKTAGYVLRAQMSAGIDSFFREGREKTAQAAQKAAPSPDVKRHVCPVTKRANARRIRTALSDDLYAATYAANEKLAAFIDYSRRVDTWSLPEAAATAAYLYGAEATPVLEKIASVAGNVSVPAVHYVTETEDVAALRDVMASFSQVKKAQTVVDFYDNKVAQSE